MKHKLYLSVYLSIIAVGLTAAFWVFVLSVNKYCITNELCNAIVADDTVKALTLIAKMDDVNSFTAPSILNKMLSLIECSIRSPLVEACRKGNYEVVKELLTKGANPNQCLQGYWSPIEATFLKPNANRLTIAQLLIEHGAEVDLYCGSDSALFNELQNAIYRDGTPEQESTFQDAVLLLLENGAAPVDKKGNTVLHYICYTGAVELLLKLSDMYENQLNIQNLKGQTPLMWAIEGESVEIVEHLLHKGVDVNAVDAEGKTSYEYAFATENATIISMITGTEGRFA